MAERPKSMKPRKGLYPEADPTAPGGMSQKELVSEMVKYHHWDKAEAKALPWTEQIDAVCQGRLDREREAKRVCKDVHFAVSMYSGPAPLFIGMPDSNDYIFDGHVGASPSGAERWIECTASLSASRAFLESLSPNQQREFASGSAAARQGTTAHAVAEAELSLALGVITQEQYDNTLLDLSLSPENGEEYTEEMEAYVADHVDFVKQYLDAGRTVLIEKRVEAVIPVGEDDNVHTINGSLDAGALPNDEEPTLTVVDLKYGEGKDVSVEHNPQVRIYALGLLGELIDEDGNLEHDIETIEYVIVQPRLGGVKVWTETLDDLLDWRDDVLSPALTKALWGKGATFSPSESVCQWCPAKGSCAALLQSRMDNASELFDVIQEAEYKDGPGAFPETGLLDNDTLGSLYSQITGLTKLAEEMKAELNRRLHRGEDVEGYHLVNYQPGRVWKDGADEALEDEDALWKRGLVTPTQAVAIAEKELKDEGLVDQLKDLIYTPPKRPVAAPVTDRRKAWEGVPPEQMFDKEE
jgi:hypothetical protein